MRRLAGTLVVLALAGATGASTAAAGTAGTVAGAPGAVLVLDARGDVSPAASATQMRAARSFAARRDPRLPLAVMTYGNGSTVLTPPTTDPRVVGDALAHAPAQHGSDDGRAATSAALDLLDTAHLDAGAIIRFTGGAGVHRENAPAGHDGASPATRPGLFAVGLATPGLETLLASAATRLSASAQPALARVAASAHAPRPVAAAASSGHSFFAGSAGHLLEVLLALAILLGGLAPLIRVRRGGSVQRRVAEYATPAPRSEAADVEFAGPQAEDDTDGGWTRRMAQLEEALDLAGIDLTAKRLLGLSVLGAIAAGLITAAVAPAPIIGIVWLFATPVAVRAFVRFRLRRQRRLFADQLGDQLQAMAAALRSGHSFSGAVAGLLQDAPEPSAGEFGRLVADERLGVPFEVAFAELVRRMDNRDLEQVALVAVLQRETGGNGAEALERVVEGLRSRLEVRRLVASLTAQGRMSRWVLTAIPVGLGVGLTAISPGYMRPLYETAAGRMALILSVALVTAGSLVIKKLIEIEV
jgi:tight adherence protein B